MLKDIKNTISQSAVYGLSRVATKLISFILIPLYTAKFVSDSIANINLLESFWQYLFTICMFAFETAIVSFCAINENDSGRRKLLFNFFVLFLINSAVVFVTGLIFSEKISLFILKESGFEKVIFYCFLISIFESLLIMPMTIARINSKPVLYSVITVSNLLINLFLQVYFIVYMDLGFEYVFLAKFIAPAAVFILFLPYVLNNLSFSIDLSEIKNVLKFSFPLMIAGLLSLLLNTVDRFILSDYVSKQDVAVYTIGYSIGSVTNAFILSPFTLAINVIFWKKLNDDNFNRFMTKSSTYLFSVMIFASILFSFILPYAIKIFVRNEQLWPAVNIIPFILFANCFIALSVFQSLDFYYKKKTQGILIIITVCLAFNFFANVVFIKYAGIFASAVITILSSLLMILTGYFMTKSFTYTKFELRKIILLSVIFIVIVSIGMTLNPENVYLDILIKLLLIFSAVLSLKFMNFFEPVEIERIKGFFNKYLFKIFK